MSQIDFIIISGTSGSGKTVALQVLEDLGFYCIDNLPASLLSDMAKRSLSADNTIKKYALSIDSRNQDISRNLKSNLTALNAVNINCRTIFIDADDTVLLKRYSETRRKHPLSNKETSLAEAINLERSVLTEIAESADLHIDTTSTTPHELRAKIKNYAADTSDAALTLQFESFGFKYGNPSDADFMFDVRCLPNPHWDDKLRKLTGLDSAVQNFLESEPMCHEMYEKIRDFIDYWLPKFIDDNRNYITVAIGCTGGQHRSVYLSNRLQNHFKGNVTIHTQVRHRELA